MAPTDLPSGPSTSRCSRRWHPPLPPRAGRDFRRCEAALAPGGEIVLCHWQHPTRDVPLDGQSFHEQAASMLRTGHRALRRGRGPADRRLGRRPLHRTPRGSHVTAVDHAARDPARDARNRCSRPACAASTPRSPRCARRAPASTWWSPSPSTAAPTGRPGSSVLGRRGSRAAGPGSRAARDVAIIERGLVRTPETARRRDLVACTDADTIVPSRWLVRHVMWAERGADLVVGTAEPVGAARGEALAAWHARHQLVEGHTHVHGANLGVRADRWRQVGGFGQRTVGEDVDLVERVRTLTGRWVATDTTRVLTSGSAAQQGRRRLRRLPARPRRRDRLSRGGPDHPPASRQDR